MPSHDIDAAHALQARLASRLKMRHLVLLQQIETHGTLTRVAHHMATSQPAITSSCALAWPRHRPLWKACRPRSSAS